MTERAHMPLNMPTAPEIETSARQTRRLRAETFARALSGAGVWCKGLRPPGGNRRATGMAATNIAGSDIATLFRQHVKAFRTPTEGLPADAAMAKGEQARVLDVVIDIERHLDALRTVILPREHGQ